jgi:hypothetical protein
MPTLLQCIIRSWNGETQPMRALIGHRPYGLAFGIAVALQLVGNAWFLLTYPAGTEMRPMGAALVAGMYCVAALLIGVPLSIADLRRSLLDREPRRVAVAVTGLLLNLGAMPLNTLIWRAFVAYSGVVMLD